MKRRGRPRLDPDDPSVDVRFRLPSKQYDLTHKQATAAKLTLAEWLRRIVAHAGRPPGKP